LNAQAARRSRRRAARKAADRLAGFLEEGEEDDDEDEGDQSIGYSGSESYQRTDLDRPWDAVVPPPLIPTRPFVARTDEMRTKLKEWKKEQSAIKIEEHKTKLRADDETWIKDHTPKWLIKQQAEKAAKAAALAAAKAAGGKGKRK